MESTMNKLRGFAAPLAGTIALLATLSACGSSEERVDEFVANAEGFLEAGRIELADVELRNALRLAPEDPDALMLRARLLERREAWVPMRDTLRRVIELEPERIEANLLLGKLLVAGGALDEAAPIVDRLLTLAPGRPGTHMLQASLLARQEAFVDARAAAQEALRLDAKGVEPYVLLADLAWRDGDFDAALERIEAGLAVDEQSVPLHLAKFRTHMSRGEPDAAAATLESLVQFYPQELRHRRDLARFHAEAGARARAEAVLRRAVAELPESSEPKLLLTAFLAEEDPEAAIEALRGFLARADEPDDALSFRLAALEEQRGGLEAARAVYQGLVEAGADGPSGLRARNELARLALQEDQTGTARQLVDAVLAVDPEEPDALLIRAYLELQDEEIDQAIIDLRTVLRGDQDSDRALHLLGRAYQLRGSDDLAEESFIRAVEANPFHLQSAKELARRWLAEGEYARADAMLSRIVEAERGDLEILEALVRTKVAREEYLEAERLAGLAAQALDRPQLVPYVQAIAQRAQGDTEGAITLLQEVVAADPDATPALTALIDSFAATGRRTAALRWLEGFIEDHPGNLAARNLLAREHAASGDWPSAVRTLEAAIAQDPQGLESYDNLARGYQGRGALEEAAATYRRALEAEPRALRVRLTLASLLERMGLTSEAEAEYRTVLEQAPELDVASNNLAMLLSRDQARLEEAYALVRHFEESDEAVYLDTVGWIQVRRGETERGALLLQRAHEAAPQVGEIAYHLGVALSERGEIAQARGYLERALAADEDAPYAEDARARLEALLPVADGR